MRRIVVLIASVVINASTIPTVASECTSSKDIDVADNRKTCRAYVASFHDSVTQRPAAVSGRRRMKFDGENGSSTNSDDNTKRRLQC